MLLSKKGWNVHDEAILEVGLMLTDAFSSFFHPFQGLEKQLMEI